MAVGGRKEEDTKAKERMDGGRVKRCTANERATKKQVCRQATISKYLIAITPTMVLVSI